jgi:putative transposase
VVDIFSRYSSATDPPFSYRGEDVVQILERYARRSVIRRRSGWTRGSKSCRAISTFGAHRRSVALDFSPPGKPTDNAFIEAFNSRFRADV